MTIKTMHEPTNIIWTTPSLDSSGSMPLGNGDIGLNVWVEENGDLLFYLSKTDAWDEHARLLKLGRIRVALSPNPFASGASFRQELDLTRGCIRIQTVDATPSSRPGPPESGGGAASTADAARSRGGDVDATPPSRFGNGTAAATTLPHYFDPREPIGHVAGGNLPHWRQDGATYFVTFRTADSMPRERVQQWSREREAWLKAHPEPNDEATRREYYHLFTERWQDWLDESHGACLLAKAEVASAVEQCLRHDDGTAYRLGEFVVMPNHVHALVTPLGAHTLSTLLQTWKSVSAHAIRKMTGTKGTFWQKESFGHIVRNADQHARIRKYIQDNPTRNRKTAVDATPSSRGEGSGDGAASTGTSILLWVDANRPVVRVEIESVKPIEARVTLELWRTAERRREGAEGGCDAGLRSPDERETVYPDIVLDGGPDALRWCHRNRASCWAATLEHQDMADWVKHGRDPLLNRTFGALLRGDGLVKSGDCVLRTAAPRTCMTFAIHPLTAQTETLEDWTAALHTQVAQTDATDARAAFAAHATWWQAFWQRSWIQISGTPEAETVSRGYELQRFVNACGGRGAFPIKFNGSIFTVDAREKDEVFDADYRRWGGAYWFQNTRLTYWPMIMSGDFDLMEPWFRMYLDALPFAIARARANFGLENAAMFPETMTFWGAFLNSNYGYTRGELAPGLSENRYIRRYWQGMLELLAVLLDLYAVTEDDDVLRDKLLVLAPPFLRFYRDYFAERDRNGKMRMAPSQSLETWHEAVNPSPDIAGLQWVLDGLLALPEDSVPEALREEWRAFRQILPPLPIRHYVWDKRTEIIPAVEYNQCANSENPELYAVFPYRLFGVGKPDLDTGLATWHARRVKETGGWRQDAIQAALLGLTDEAKRDVVKNFSTPHAGSRFPAFWGPNFDWIPDQDHGSAACIALQRMLLQWDLPEPADATPSSRGEGSGEGAASTVGAKQRGAIRLLPAWPKVWHADFRLHAPGKTVVEGSVRDGHLTELRVTPGDRAVDIQTGEPK